MGISRLFLSDLNAQAFPSILFSLELSDSSGAFVADLKPTELTLYEDGQALQAAELKIQPRRLQFTLAVNAAPELAARPANPQPDSPASQMEGIRKALLAWTAAQVPAGGDYSLATSTGMQVIRANEPAQLAQALKDYQPDLAKSQSGLFSLSTALNLINERGLDETARPAILWVTPPLDETQSAGLAQLSAQAAKMGAAVFVWLVTPDFQNPPAGQEALQALADSTGGKLAMVNASEAFPALEDWFKPLRLLYQVRYLSHLQKGGAHTLSARVDRPNLQLSAGRELRFDLDVRPPNPMFVNPPALLERSWSAATSSQPSELGPQSMALEVVMEFPDGHPRELRATRLYQNDLMVAENTAEPFNRFTWKVDGLTQNESLKLHVEALDTIGLMGSSIEVPVEVRVAAKPETSLLPHVSTQGLIAVGAVLLAGLALGLVILGENRLRRRRQSKSVRRRMQDPVTQPVVILQESARARKPLSPPAWPRLERASSAPARLARLNENEQPAPGGPVPINRPELTFGRDAHLAIITLDDPSVQALHARLTQTREGDFLLQDEHSVAGTWVNYVALNGQGRKLLHGDLIHMGRVMFRFELAVPPPPREPLVSLVDEAL